MSKRQTASCGYYTKQVFRKAYRSLHIHTWPTTALQDKKARKSLFADDSSLDTSGKTLKEIEVMQQKVSTMFLTGEKNHICLNQEKNDKCMVITTRQKHQGSRFHLKLETDSETVTQVNENQVLGLCS